MRPTIWLAALCLVSLAHSAAARDDPAAAARLGAMPDAIGTVAVPPPTLLAETRRSLWALHATAANGALVQGSAVAVGADRLLTTCHLLRGANAIELRQGAARRGASLIRQDARLDRCILAVAGPALVPVRAVRPFAHLRLGERVYSVSAPAGGEVRLGEGVLTGIDPGVPILRTNAPMMPGSSGGALVDAGGNLVAIIAFRAREAPELGFALPAESFWSLP